MDNDKIKKAMLTINGLTFYSYGIHHQIKNINLIIEALEGNEMEFHLIVMAKELAIFLESISKLGEIENYYD